MKNFRIAIVMDDTAAGLFEDRAGYDFGVAIADVRNPAQYVRALINLYGPGFTIARAIKPRNQESAGPEERVDILYTIGVANFPQPETTQKREIDSDGLEDAFEIHIKNGWILGDRSLRRARHRENVDRKRDRGDPGFDPVRQLEEAEYN